MAARRLADVCEAIVDCPHSTPVWTDSGVIVLRNQNIRRGRLDLSSPSYTDEKHYEERTRRIIPQKDDLVITREAPMGEVCLLPAGLRCCLGQRMVLLRAKASSIDPRYLLYALQSPAVQHEILVNEGTGSTVSNLRIPILESLPIPCPPLPEQKRIAHILGTLDDKIELNRRMNATLEDISRAIFKSWFVDFDPVRQKAAGQQPVGMEAQTAALFPDSFEDSEIGEVPKGWRVGPLDSIASVVMGLSPKGDSYNDMGVGVPLINGPVEFGDYFPVKTKWTTAATRLASPDDLILCVRGSTTGRRVVSNGAYAIGRGVCALTASQEFHTFLYETMSHSLGRLLSKTTGSVFPSLSAPDIKGLPVLIPPAVILESHRLMVDGVTRRVQAGQVESSRLAALRDTLLPKLLSGEVRVPEAEEAVEEVLS